MDLFCYLCFAFVMLSCLFFAATWSPDGKGLTSLGSLVCDNFCVFFSFSFRCSGSDMLLNCIDS